MNHHPLLCVFLCVCSPGIDEVLQECGDKAKAVAVRHTALSYDCVTLHAD